MAAKCSIALKDVDPPLVVPPLVDLDLPMCRRAHRAFSPPKDLASIDAEGRVTAGRQAYSTRSFAWVSAPVRSFAGLTIS